MGIQSRFVAVIALSERSSIGVIGHTGFTAGYDGSALN